MGPAFPHWLTVLSATSIAIALTCAAIVAIDEIQRPQAMWIMNLVWPLTTLFGGIIWLAGYAAWARAHRKSGSSPGMTIAVAKGASHCGAGCVLGDLIGEALALAFPPVVALFGWRWLFNDRIFAVWALDFILALMIGIAFQYFAIQGEENRSISERVIQALKADVMSIAAWQVGMFGFMAAAQFLWLRPRYGGTAGAVTPVFWFAMQLAMLCGFVTAYPVNWLLVRTGLKEKM